MSEEKNLMALVEKSVGDGIVVYGFVAAADKGLDPHEYVICSRKVQAFSSAERLTASKHDVHALSFDAARVAKFGLPDALVPLVVASRFWSCAMGLVTDEAEPVPKGKPGEIPEGLLRRVLAINKGVATLPIYITTVMYYNTNHNTGGSVLPKGFLKILRSALGLDSSITDFEITRSVYLGGHAADKRLSLRSFSNLEPFLVRPQTRGDVVSAGMDSWAAVRSNLRPAGTHSLSVLRVVLSKITSMGLAGLSPMPQAISALRDAFAQFRTHPHSFHPGAKFLFDLDPLVLLNVEEVKGWIGYFGGFCREYGICISVYSSFQYRRLAEECSNPTWTALGKSLVQSTAASVETATAAIKAIGSTLGDRIPDPTKNAEGYARCNQEFADILLNMENPGGRAPDALVVAVPDEMEEYEVFEGESSEEEDDEEEDMEGVEGGEETSEGKPTKGRKRGRSRSRKRGAAKE